MSRLKYTLTEIDWLCDSCGCGWISGLNNDGLVAGKAHYKRAFVWDRDRGLQFLMEEPPMFNYAAAINDQGQIAGETNDVFFLWERGQLIHLPIASDKIGEITAMNNHGQVVGFYFVDTSVSPYISHAFLWDQASGLYDLGTLGGTRSYATGINNVGDIIGTVRFGASDETEVERGFLWRDGTLIDLGSFLPDHINDQGHIVGTTPPGQPCMWIDHQLITLPTLLHQSWTILRDANEHGDVVGLFRGNNYDEYRAVLYRDGSVFDLNELYPLPDEQLWHDAMAINDHRQVVAIALQRQPGQQWLASGVRRKAFLLTPDEG